MEIPFFLLFLIYLSTFLPFTHSLTPDGLSLLALKSAITSDPTRTLTKWSETDTTPCHWPGITCSPTTSSVTSLSLPNLHLTGYIPYELGALFSLQTLSLRNNNFSGSIPSRLFNTSSTSTLTALDLSHNSLSGPIPSNLPSTLVSLDLSSNLLNGSLPSHLSNLIRLTGTLNLSYNRFSGGIPASFGKFPVMVSLDLRHNNLTGKIPQEGSLLNQGPTAFAGNPSLCGFPLNNACPEATDPNLPLNPGEISVNNENPDMPKNRYGENRKEETEETTTKPKLRVFSLPVIGGVFIVIGAVVLSVLVARRTRRRLSTTTTTTATKSVKGSEKSSGDEKSVYQMEMGVGSVNESEGGRQAGKFVVLDEGFELDLEDLLRASAYVVGKSRSGIVYKVVVGGSGGSGKFGVVGGTVLVGGATGTVVAVRRLSEGEDFDGGTWRMREFESEVEAIGKVHHPNVVRLRAYYYASDEKLLVSDFVRGGSLYTALHGTASNDSAPLSWASRLKIAQGAARGLTHIHECSPRKYVHGNIKSSKILLDEDLKPYISGFGLHRLVSSYTSRSSSSAAAAALLLTSNINKQRPHHHHHHGLSSISINGSEILYPSSSAATAYIAPEARVAATSGGRHHHHQQQKAVMSQKCDVYSFGIVLMEMLTGQLPEGDGKKQGLLEEVVRKVFREERPLSEIIDPALLHEVHAKKQVLAMFHVALSCTEREADLRPRMRAVLETLEGIK